MTLLAPLVAIVGLQARRGAKNIEAHSVEADRRPPLIQPFIIGFTVCIGLLSNDVLGTALLDKLKVSHTVLPGAALFGLGCSVSVRRLRNVGGRPLLLGLTSWLMVPGFALVAARTFSNA